MRNLLLLVLFLLAPGVALRSQDVGNPGRLVKVTFTETRRHLSITIKTPEEPVNPGTQGEFRVQFRRGEDYVVYNDKASPDSKTRRVELDVPKNVTVLKVFFFVPGRDGNKPFGLAFGRNLFSIPVPDQPEEDPSKLVFTIGEDGPDEDGFAASAVTLMNSQKWHLLLDSDDLHKEINPMAAFAHQPTTILTADGAIETVADINGDGEIELEFSNDIGNYGPLNPQTGSKVGWLGKIPGAFETGERVMIVGGQYVIVRLIRGAR
jgi:hypothetical protein